uniref:Zf-RING_14 domain-containing protein n=1 Tax=Heterorhabditis bacteriophora TaxID=37862 RepID=A0A1I7WKW5_HETBA
MKGEEPLRTVAYRCDCPAILHFRSLFDRVQPKVGDKLHLRLNIDAKSIANKYREGNSREREIAEVEPERCCPLCGVLLSGRFVIINVKPIPFGLTTFPTRLETRTEECNSIRESRGGENPRGGMKVKAAAHHGPMGSAGRIHLGIGDSWSSGAWLYPVKRMIRGLGGETISTYSQTFNGYDVSVSLLNC